ncbi:MAG: hypothetical protein WBC52_04890, partial [Candidatus Omnitrophota bacterium]
MDILHNADIWTFHFINSSCKNPVCDLLIPWITNLGSSLFIFGLAIVLLFAKRRDIKVLVILLFAGNTLSYY